MQQIMYQEERNLCRSSTSTYCEEFKQQSREAKVKSSLYFERNIFVTFSFTGSALLTDGGGPATPST
jgi:hypothetical protein